MPLSKRLLVNPADLDLTLADYSMLGGLRALMYIYNHETAYLPWLHISKATNIKVVVDKVCPQLPVWDAAKKKGFKLYFSKEFSTRKMKVDVVNYSKNWNSLSSGKKLVKAPDAFDTKIFWN